MNSPTLSSPQKRVRMQRRPQRQQRGIVLVIALIMLVVISLLTVTSIRSAATSETLAGNVRTTELATQAAEIALRFCEAAAVRVGKGNTTNTTSTPNLATVTQWIATPGTWKNLTTWDTAGATPTYVLPSTAIGTDTFKRQPECMIESLSGSTTALTGGTGSFVITVRGFGPEVAAGTGRPKGTEVWLQSTIQF